MGGDSHAEESCGVNKDTHPTLQKGEVVLAHFFPNNGSLTWPHVISLSECWTLRVYRDYNEEVQWSVENFSSIQGNLRQWLVGTMADNIRK